MQERPCWQVDMRARCACQVPQAPAPACLLPAPGCRPLPPPTRADPSACPASRAPQGDVLEVSAGTGRNLPYYPLGRMRSLTLTDTSRPMLINAADKFAAMAENGDAPAEATVRFELADAQHLVAKAASSAAASSDASGSSGSGAGMAAAAGGAAEAAGPPTPRQQGEGAAVGAAAPHRPPLREQQRFAPHSFDVVVDTFGLCSQQDPVTALKAGCFSVVWVGAGAV